jgi:hypothetical protein
MVYITENIIALGFPDTYNSPNILGFKEVCFLEALSNISGNEGQRHILFWQLYARSMYAVLRDLCP